MAQMEFEDYSIKVTAALNEATIAALYEAAGEIESYAKRTSPVDSGELAGSWKHHVDEQAAIATIGSEIQNAIWNEFGTGQYALSGDGRKTKWVYQDRKGNWHTTSGKRPRRTLFKAFEAVRPKISKIFEEELGGMK